MSTCQRGSLRTQSHQLSLRLAGTLRIGMLLGPGRKDQWGTACIPRCLNTSRARSRDTQFHRRMIDQGRRPHTPFRSAYAIRSDSARRRKRLLQACTNLLDTRCTARPLQWGCTSQQNMEHMQMPQLQQCSAPAGTAGTLNHCASTCPASIRCMLSRWWRTYHSGMPHTLRPLSRGCTDWQGRVGRWSHCLSRCPTSSRCILFRWW